MNKRYNLFYFWIILPVIAMFNVLQAGKKVKDLLNFSRGIAHTYPLTVVSLPVVIYLGSNLCESLVDKNNHRKHMAKFGSEDMDHDAQKKTRQTLHDMGIKNSEEVLLKELVTNNEADNEAETTSTGIWINPDLLKKRGDYVRYRAAGEYWERKKKHNSTVFRIRIATQVTGFFPHSYYSQ